MATQGVGNDVQARKEKAIKNHHQLGIKTHELLELSADIEDDDALHFIQNMPIDLSSKSILTSKSKNNTLDLKD